MVQEKIYFPMSQFWTFMCRFSLWLTFLVTNHMYINPVSFSKIIFWVLKIIQGNKQRQKTSQQRWIFPVFAPKSIKTVSQIVGRNYQLKMSKLCHKSRGSQVCIMWPRNVITSWASRNIITSWVTRNVITSWATRNVIYIFSHQICNYILSHQKGNYILSHQKCNYSLSNQKCNYILNHQKCNIHLRSPEM